MNGLGPGGVVYHVLLLALRQDKRQVVDDTSNSVSLVRSKRYEMPARHAIHRKASMKRVGTHGWTLPSTSR